MKHILLVLAFICQPAFAFSSFDTISLIFKGIQFLHTESVPKEIIVSETGMGKTQTEAQLGSALAQIEAMNKQLKREKRHGLQS
jgi:hypothetical protein